jgi:PadR family transcriptional regulator, regulatory protein PadR
MALTPQVFQILLSLADRPRHGYAIIQDIRERTSDAIRLTASTLYDALARLADQALIEEVEVEADQPGNPDRDSRRRYYQLTRRGRETAEAEARLLERSTETARERRLLPRK